MENCYFCDVFLGDDEDFIVRIKTENGSDIDVCVDCSSMNDDEEIVLKEHEDCEWCGELIINGKKAQQRKYIHNKLYRESYQHPECWKVMCLESTWLTIDGFVTGEFKRGTDVSRY